MAATEASDDADKKRTRIHSDEAIAVESTSEDTQSTGSQGQSLDDELIVAEACRPLTNMLKGVARRMTRKFLFDVQAGLSGTDTLHQFPCLHDLSNGRFYVWLGDTDFALFTKSAFMNLSNFAEGQLGAKTVIFLVYHEHRQKTQYRNMFRVVDAKRLHTEAVMDHIGASERQAAKAVVANTLFYELGL